MKRLIVVLAVVLTLVLGAVAPALAASTAEVTITAQPSYISITIAGNSTSYDFGTVVINYLANTTTNRLFVANASGINIDVTIGTNATEWSGGLGWHVSETAETGNHTAGLKASHGTGNFTTVVRNAVPLMLYNTCTVATTSWAFELQLVTPNEYTDGVQKSIKVVLTATATP